MKQTLLVWAFMLSSMVVAAQAKPAQCDSWHQSKELEQVVVAFGDAVNDMTAASLEWGRDSETQWAIDTVNTIWTRRKSKPFDFMPYMADITMMQSYFAYGVSYVPYILYYGRHYQEVSDGKYTLKSLYDDFRDMKDSMYISLQNNPKWQDYFFMNACTYTLLESYIGFMNDLVEDYPEPYYATLAKLQYTDSVYAAPGITPEYYAWRLDGAMFFMAYCQWIIYSRDKLQNYESLISNIQAYASVFDSFANPIVNAITEGKLLPSVTESEAKDYLLQTLPIRTKMLRLLEKNLKAHNSKFESPKSLVKGITGSKGE